MRILAIGAHADDIELGCGGTLARLIENGHQVKCLYTSDSTFTNEFGETQRTRDCVVRELKDAMTCLGVTDYLELGFPSKDIPFSSDLVSEIDKVINEFKPDIIFTHWVFDTHQSHKNTAEASISAGRNIKSILMYEPYAPSGRSYMPFRPQMYFDINIDKKISAIKAHKSQVEKYGNSWFEGIEGRARIRGYEMREKYGEVFEVVRFKFL